MTSNAMSLSFIYQTIQPKSVKGTQFFPNSPSPNLLHKVLMELAQGGAVVVGHGSVCHAKNITLFRT
uniref:Uncharacterized protein n=1 Tax=Helianthus annuus TaxID=4232 RepID=A0A251TT00_HELAN